LGPRRKISQRLNLGNKTEAMSFFVTFHPEMPAGARGWGA
jgi:hypothetical protein